MTLRLQRSSSFAGAGLTAAALLLTACGGGSSTADPAPANDAPVAPAASGAPAAAGSAVNYAGTLREPAATARAAAKDKKVVIISAGQASISSSVPVAAAKEAAEAANRAKSNFLAVTSHEVRTPLNAVLGLSEALKREALTPRQKELNDGVLASGEMLLRLLDAVLDMSRIEANQATARPSDFDIMAKLRAIASIWTPRAQELGVALTLDTSGLDRERVRQDEGRVEQTLVNLISNALKFTPAGGEVRVVATSATGRLRLEVIDGGPGVPEADRERVFQAFEQTEAGRAAGATGWLVKPFDPAKLVEVIGKVIR
mgnify:CR=1 FL=1